MGEWRSFSVQLKPLLSKGDYALLQKAMTVFQQELDSLLDSEDFRRASRLCRGHSVGDYMNCVARRHSPHHKWTYPGERAKYYRLLLAQVYATEGSLAQRQAVAEHCARHGWRAESPELREDLEAAGFYPTAGNLRNICRSGTMPQLPRTMALRLDFSAGDRQVVLQDGLSYSLKVFDSWVRFTVEAPSHLRPHEGRFSKPRIQRDEDGELVAYIAYEATVENPRGSAVLGADIGKIKVFAASAQWKDGSYSTELAPSREAQALQSKAVALREQLKELWGKIRRQEALLSGRHSEQLALKNQTLRGEARLLSGKLSRQKLHLSRLAARDLINHARAVGARELHLEILSWLDSTAGKWDHAQLQRCMEEEARRAGMQVMYVNAKNTSSTDPFSGVHSEPDDERRISLVAGGDLDRDYTASLEIGRRRKRGGRAKLRQGACRDKHHPTPKRPKAPSNKRKRLAASSAGVVRSPIVAVAGEVRVSAHLVKEQTNTTTHKVLQC